MCSTNVEIWNACESIGNLLLIHALGSDNLDLNYRSSCKERPGPVWKTLERSLGDLATGLTSYVWILCLMPVIHTRTKSLISHYPNCRHTLASEKPFLTLFKQSTSPLLSCLFYIRPAFLMDPGVIPVQVPSSFKSPPKRWSKTKSAFHISCLRR